MDAAGFSEASGQQNHPDYPPHKLLLVSVRYHRQRLNKLTQPIPSVANDESPVLTTE